MLPRPTMHSRSHKQCSHPQFTLLILAVTAIGSGCTEAAGLHEHEAYKGFPDSVSVRCSDGVDMFVACDPMPGGFPQDEHTSMAAPSYELLAEKNVRDKVTGLVWHSEPFLSMNYDSAVRACDDLGSDYRLPSRLELISLLDYGDKSLSLINKDAFSNVKPTRYRTSTPYLDQPATHWGVSFSPTPIVTNPMYPPYEPGEVQSMHDSGGAGVLCVKRDSEPFVSGPFEPAGKENKFLRDARTGLFWIRESIEAKGWLDALQQCDNAQHGGYEDFRVPNAKEIATLVNDEAPVGSKSQIHSAFIVPLGERLWSSTPSSDPSKAFMLDAGGASIAGTLMSYDYHQVLCVRGPD